MTYSPSWFVSAGYATPVSTCVAVTRTPGSADPVASVTRPDSDAAASARRGDAAKHTITHTTSAKRLRAIRDLLGCLAGRTSGFAPVRFRSIRAIGGGTYRAWRVRRCARAGRTPGTTTRAAATGRSQAGSPRCRAAHALLRSPHAALSHARCHIATGTHPRRPVHDRPARPR